MNCLKTDVTTEKKQEYIVISLGNDLFGVNISKINGITVMSKPTELPEMAPFMRGLIDVRGQFIPVIDLSIRLGSKNDISIFSKKEPVVITEVNGDLIGVLVETVVDVVAVSCDDYQETTDIGKEMGQDMIDGVFKYKGSPVVILNLEKIFSQKNPIETIAV